MPPATPSKHSCNPAGGEWRRGAAAAARAPRRASAPAARVDDAAGGALHEGAADRGPLRTSTLLGCCTRDGCCSACVCMHLRSCTPNCCNTWAPAKMLHRLSFSMPADAHVTGLPGPLQEAPNLPGALGEHRACGARRCSFAHPASHRVQTLGAWLQAPLHVSLEHAGGSRTTKADRTATVLRIGGDLAAALARIPAGWSNPVQRHPDAPDGHEHTL